jgi:hypothetical protein
VDKIDLNCSTHGKEDNPTLNICVERIYVRQIQPSVSPYDRGSTLYCSTEFGELLAHSIILLCVYIYILFYSIECIYMYTYNSFRSLSYDRSIVSPKATSPQGSI